MEATLSIWQIPPESAKRVGHPAPFPVDLAKRVIQLYSYVDDVVLDPFAGSGTTCVAAAALGRYYVGYDISEAMIEQAKKENAEDAGAIELVFILDKNFDQDPEIFNYSEEKLRKYQ